MSDDATHTPVDKSVDNPVLGRAVADAAAHAAKGRRRRRKPPRSGYSGSGPDPRDPAPVAKVLNALVASRGWREQTAAATVFAAWDRIAGPDLATHCRPVLLRDGELVLAAESTAWATQVRMLARTIVAKIADSVGDGVVKVIRCQGPTSTSWGRGRLSVSGRGPRDTYG